MAEHEDMTVEAERAGELTIAEFLESRIAEDELLAEAASSDGASWDAVKGMGGSSGAVHAGGELTIDEDGDDNYYGGSPIVYDEGTPDSFQAEHIATHDPARVLAECAAKRAIIEMWEDPDNFGPLPDAVDAGAAMATDDAVKALAAVYSHHPDYQREWAA